LRLEASEQEYQLRDGFNNSNTGAIVFFSRFWSVDLIYCELTSKLKTDSLFVIFQPFDKFIWGCLGAASVLLKLVDSKNSTYLTLLFLCLRQCGGKKFGLLFLLISLAFIVLNYGYESFITSND
jgi:hypothetical protein